MLSSAAERLNRTSSIRILRSHFSKLSFVVSSDASLSMDEMEPESPIALSRNALKMAVALLPRVVFLSRWIRFRPLRMLAIGFFRSCAMLCE